MTGGFVHRTGAWATRPVRRWIRRRRRNRVHQANYLEKMHSRGKGTQRIFVFEGTAVLVQPWHAVRESREQGARVEVRLLRDREFRGSVSASQQIVLGQPIVRVDLFDLPEAQPGGYGRAHFHPEFDGMEPGARHWSDALTQNPEVWLTEHLGDLRALFEQHGSLAASATWLDADAAALRAVIPEILGAVDETMRAVRDQAAVYASS